MTQVEREYKLRELCQLRMGAARLCMNLMPQSVTQDREAQHDWEQLEIHLKQIREWVINEIKGG